MPGMMKKICLLALLVFALANAATVKGTVFDSNLDPIKAIVSLNTTPLQTMVAQNGSFSFQIQKGTYVLTATAGNHSVSETVRVVEEGVFNLDLILFGFEDPALEIPQIEEGTGFEGQNTGEGLESSPTPQPQFPRVFAGIIVAAIAVLAFLVLKWKKLGKKAEGEKTGREKKEARKETPHKEKPLKGLNEFQERIIEEMRKSEGRITQRELRKLLPWSEAKVSIELDLLEEKGVIKKFKKGRGNIIILSERGK